MKCILRILTSLLLLASLPTALAHEDGTPHSHEDVNLLWSTLETTLPKPLSDLTATLDTTANKVYIAGGCDSPLGNEFLQEDGFFVCNSISNALYEYNVDTNSFTTLPNLPRARYRHAAALVDNKLWLIGGRALDDSLIPQVDVYDINSQTWSTVGDLPEAYQTSDHGSFTTNDDTFVYIVGGYDANYTSLSAVWRLDTTTNNGTLEIQNRAPLQQPRGDVTAVYDDHSNFAYMSGGFSHTNDFCQPLESVERYHVKEDTWQLVAPLQTPRAEKVLVTIHNQVYAVGGETHIQDYCNSEVDHDVGEQTVAVDTVEVYDPSQDEWRILWSLPNHKFRFAAVSVDDTIYTFGGQAAFQEKCQCFATTDDIVAYTEVNVTSNGEAASVGWMLLVLAVMTGMCM